LSTAVQIDADNFWLCGSSYSPPSGTKTAAHKGKADYYVVAINRNGQVVFDKSFGGAEDDLLKAVNLNDKKIILAGDSRSDASADKAENNRDNSLQTADVWLLSLDLNGNTIWEKTYGVEFGEGVTSVTSSANGNALVAAWSSSFGFGLGTDKTEPNIGNSGKADIWLLNINSLGKKLWDESIGTIDVDMARFIHLTTTGLCVIASTDASLSNKAPNNDRTKPLIGEQNVWTSFWTFTGKQEVPKPEQMVVYPNPVSDVLNIKDLNLTGNIQLLLININTKQQHHINRFVQTDGGIKFNLQDGLEPGFYAAIILKDGNVHLQTLVLKQ